MPFRLQLRMALLAQYSNQNHRPSHPSWRISVGKHPRGETNLGAIPNPNKTVSYQVEQVGCRIHQISIGGEPGVRKGWAPTAIPSQPPPLSSFFKTNDSVYQHSALPIVDETSMPILLCCVRGNDRRLMPTGALFHQLMLSMPADAYRRCVNWNCFCCDAGTYTLTRCRSVRQLLLVLSSYKFKIMFVTRRLKLDV